jgi:hypothetical protein
LQVLGGSTSTLFYNFSMNSIGLALNKGLTITGALQLVNGKINSTDTNLVILMDGATADSGSSSSFVNGPLKKIGNDAFVFPVGKNSSWRRIAISAPGTVSSEFVAEYFDSAYANVVNVNAPLNAVTSIEHWTLDAINTTDSVAVRLYWEDAAASAISSCAELGIAHWNNATWENIPSGTVGSCLGNEAGSIQSLIPMADYGVFTFGFYGNVTVQNFTVCHGDSIFVDTNVYHTTGTYVDVLVAADLSDSTVITHLDVLFPVIVQQNINLCYGGTLTVGTHQYVVAGNYSDTLATTFGCDSIVNTILTIQDSNIVSVSLDGIILTSNDTNATTYQWVDCSNNYAPINGAIQQSFTPTVNGQYAVIVINNFCADTSACYAVTSVGIKKEEEMPLLVFPNPAKNKIILRLSGNINLSLYDVTGRMLLNEKLMYNRGEIDLSSYSSGIYFMEVVKGTKISRIKIIKQ